jgi:hypothetical protein
MPGLTNDLLWRSDGKEIGTQSRRFVVKSHRIWILLAMAGILLVAPIASASEVVSCPPCRDRLEDRFDRREDRRDRRENVRDRREDRRDRRN